MSSKIDREAAMRLIESLREYPEFVSALGNLVRHRLTDNLLRNDHEGSMATIMSVLDEMEKLKWER